MPILIFSPVQIIMTHPLENPRILASPITTHCIALHFYNAEYCKYLTTATLLSLVFCCLSIKAPFVIPAVWQYGLWGFQRGVLRILFSSCHFISPELWVMAIRVLELSNGGYKIKKVFASELTYPKEIIKF